MRQEYSTIVANWTIGFDLKNAHVLGHAFRLMLRPNQLPIYKALPMNFLLV
jgi:hypothetical protein